MSSITPDSIPLLVLCGGRGTRLRPVLGDRAKVLATAAGEPILRHLFAYVIANGFRDVVLCTGFQAEEVVRCATSVVPDGVALRESRETSPLGTGGAVKKALSCIDDRVLAVLNGDSFLDGDLSRVCEAHAQYAAVVTMALVHVSDVTRFGSVSVADGGAVTSFNEKVGTGAGWINGGFYVMQREALSNVSNDVFVSLEHDVLPTLVGAGLYAVKLDGAFIDVGTPESLAAADRMFRDRAERNRLHRIGLTHSRHDPGGSDDDQH
jgi:D-glycero-alpha-D-manno-heptose 1-phosphate guanylyltransferase